MSKHAKNKDIPLLIISQRGSKFTSGAIWENYVKNLLTENSKELNL
jgi:hypothetical protein